MTRTRTAARRVALGATVAVAVILGWAGPALAHVEVEADKAQAGATDVTVSFSAEAENDNAGAAAVEVVLPAGIPPADVSFVSGPTGWAPAATATGLKISGPALKVGQNADYKIKIAKLPVDATSLPFKTLVTYGDGRIDRWIEIPVAGQAEPEHPAPVLTLSPAAAGTTPSAAATTTPAATPTPLATSAPPAAPSATGGSSAGWWIGLVVAVLLVIGAAVWWIRRRGRGGDASS